MGDATGAWVVCQHCGERCAWAEDMTAGDCWGSVTAVDQRADEDGEFHFIHACSGHMRLWFGGGYVRMRAVTLAPKGQDE